MTYQNYLVSKICLIQPNIWVALNNFQVFIRFQPTNFVNPIKYFVNSTKRFCSMNQLCILNRDFPLIKYLFDSTNRNEKINLWLNKTNSWTVLTENFAGPKTTKFYSQTNKNFVDLTKYFSERGKDITSSILAQHQPLNWVDAKRGYNKVLSQEILRAKGNWNTSVKEYVLTPPWPVLFLSLIQRLSAMQYIIVSARKTCIRTYDIQFYECSHIL